MLTKSSRITKTSLLNRIYLHKETNYFEIEPLIFPWILYYKFSYHPQVVGTNSLATERIQSYQREISRDCNLFSCFPQIKYLQKDHLSRKHWFKTYLDWNSLVPICSTLFVYNLFRVQSWQFSRTYFCANTDITRSSTK